MERRFRANHPAVASEIIDGEAVIMNLKTGAYFSARGLGSRLWEWIEHGVSESAIQKLLADGYPDSATEAAASVPRFIDRLLEHDLIRPLPAGSSESPYLLKPLSPSGAPFAAPELEVYNDMQDLLLLDPIHDVDEAAGWPSPKPSEETAA